MQNVYSENFHARSHAQGTLFLWELSMVLFYGTRCSPKIKMIWNNDFLSFACSTGIKKELNLWALKQRMQAARQYQLPRGLIPIA